MLVRNAMKWNTTTEVVVIGYGLAGAATAITAHDEGAKVIILEKQRSDSHHTNSSLSGGAFIVPSNVKDIIRYMEALCHVGEGLYWTDRTIIRAWAKYAYHNKDWMEKLGVKPKLTGTIGEHRHVPGADSVHLYSVPGRGFLMMKIVDQAVRSRGIPIMYGTAAENLLTDSNRQIIGVRAKQSKVRGKINIEASKAVVLTCGGFEFDEQMKLNYLGVYPTYFMGCSANMGDGIRMALEVGADLWHMNCCSAGIAAKFPDYPTAFMFELGGQGWTVRMYRGQAIREKAGYIVVDRNGQRFVNENNLGAKVHAVYYEFTVFDTEHLAYPRVPGYWIFDQNRIEAGPLIFTLAGASGPQQLYKWSKDNKKEVEKGWLIKADTVRNLSSALDIQPDALERTVGSYNLCCERGKDPDFGRQPSDLIALSRPPFYAVKLWPGGANTQGGPKRNSKAQVLDTYGKPIPRLYAAGELGSIFGKIYPGGGGNLSECIAFGRIAGENAAREKRRV